MIRLLPIILLAGCVACRPDIPDDASVVCLDGELWIYSKEAKQRMKTHATCAERPETGRRDETI